MDLATQQGQIPSLGIQTISLRQEVLQGSRLCMKTLSERLIDSLEPFSASSPVLALRRVGQLLAVSLYRDTRMKIRQMKPRSRCFHRNAIRSIQTEKPHPRLIARPYVSAHIELRESRQTGQRRRAAQPHPRHAKRHDAHPGASSKRVNLQAAWNEFLHLPNRHFPVREQQVVPVLRHQPRPFRQCPRPVLHRFQGGMHSGLIYPRPALPNRIQWIPND